MATQISFLRYQSFFVTYVVHMGCLALDLAALVYFWYRQARRRQDWQPRGRVRALALNALSAVLLFAFAAVYLGIPPTDSQTTGRRAAENARRDFWELRRDWDAAFEAGAATALASVSRAIAAFTARNLWEQPLDLGLCRHLGWGCRYLRLDHQLLVAEKPDEETLHKLRTGEGDLEKLLVRVEGLFLRKRSFRFADFSDSEFYDADLIRADLTNALFENAKLQDVDLSGTQMQGLELQNAQMQGAHLLQARMQGAVLREADMRGADLEYAEMQGAVLREADMRGVVLRNAEMQGADLYGAHMQGAHLQQARMQGASLYDAQMQGADLENAQMQGAELVAAQIQGADLTGAQMQRANLWIARMQGANLRYARMQGAYLRDAQMQGADLRGAGLWQVEFDETSNLSLADLRGIDSKQIAEEDLEKSLEARSSDRVKEALRLRLCPQVWPKVTVEPDMPALVDARNHPCFANIEEHLTTDEKTYDAILAGYLADLARGDADIAPGIVRRVLPQRRGFHDADRAERARSLWPDLARRLLVAEKEGAFKLDLSLENRKRLEELAAKAPAPPP